jgi:hypothetical protein
MSSGYCKTGWFKPIRFNEPTVNQISEPKATREHWLGRSRAQPEPSQSNHHQDTFL